MSEQMLSEQLVSEQTKRWASTMHAHPQAHGYATAHADTSIRVEGRVLDRVAREALEDQLLAVGASRAVGAGRRLKQEEPDAERTCFERDRDRILHSPAFRRLAGKTQVFTFPEDHQRTRLTHALEVTQVASAMARATGLNVALTEAIALGHDCGHGPGGHASEEALGCYLPEGYDHAVWGADVALAPLNLCEETLDGIRNHSWSRPSPQTPEGEVVSWADRCAYTAHDFEDAVHEGVVSPASLPKQVREVLGSTRTQQLHTMIAAVVECVRTNGAVGMAQEYADALSTLRAFNYQHIYQRSTSQSQARRMISVLRTLVDAYCDEPALLPTARDGLEPQSAEAVRSAVAYVAGMTDRYAVAAAAALRPSGTRLTRPGTVRGSATGRGSHPDAGGTSGKGDRDLRVVHGT